MATRWAKVSVKSGSLFTVSNFCLRPSISRPSFPCSKLHFVPRNDFGSTSGVQLSVCGGTAQRPRPGQKSVQFQAVSSNHRISAGLSPFGSQFSTILKPKNGIRHYAAANFSTSGVFFKEALADSSDTIISPKVPESETFVVPEPPAVPEIGELMLQGPTSNLHELGLDTWWPAGLLRSALDFMHVSLDLPWWGAIIIATVIARICVFPLTVKAQKNAALMSRVMPEMQRLQMRMTDARQRGDIMGTAQTANDLQEFMKKEGFNPLKSMLPPFIQAPVFMSFFFGLRKMAAAPVESMKEGGLWWFTDLTVLDPYYILPLATSITLLAVIELGVDTGMAANQQMAVMKNFMRALPVVTFFCTSGIIGFFPAFPAAILLYWFTSNTVSLAQAGLLRIPAVRAKMGIPPMVKYAPGELPMKKKSWREAYAESAQNSRIAREMDDRTRLDAVNFRQAGMGPIRKTYKYDPTKVPVIKPAAVSTVPAQKAKN